MSTDPIIIARYFTPKVQWSVRQADIKKNHGIPGTIRMNCGPYLDGINLRSAMLKTFVDMYDCNGTLFEIEGVAIEWFEVQYKSDSRFYAINSAGDTRRLRSASFLGSPSTTNIGGMQFPEKVFSFSGAHFDSKVFQTYMQYGGMINMDIIYKVPSFLDYGEEAGEETIFYTTRQ